MQRILFATSLATLTTASVTLAQNSDDAGKRLAPDFVTVDTLVDADAINWKDDERPGAIDDLVIDADSGRVMYALLDTNGMLGSQDKLVAVPYGAFAWNPKTQNFAVDITLEELRNLPAIDPDSIEHLEHESWLSTSRAIFGERPEMKWLRSTTTDSYSRPVAHGPSKTLAGRVLAVNHETRGADGSAFTSVTITNDDGASKHIVLLAPESFLNEREIMPKNDATLVVTGVPAMDENGTPVFVAQSMRCDGTRTRLRNRDGAPEWSRATPASGIVLASSLDDDTVYALGGREFGAIDEIVFEAHSGALAYMVVSTGGVLGIDATEYPVPAMSVMLGTKNRIHACAELDHLKTAPKLSDAGLDDLDHDAFTKRVYDYFDLDAPSYDTERAMNWSKAVDRVTPEKKPAPKPKRK